MGIKILLKKNEENSKFFNGTVVWDGYFHSIWCKITKKDNFVLFDLKFVEIGEGFIHLPY